MSEEERESFCFYWDSADAFRDMALTNIQNKATLHAVLQLQLEILRLLQPGEDPEELKEEVEDMIRTSRYNELANLATRYPKIAETLRRSIDREK